MEQAHGKPGLSVRVLTCAVAALLTLSAQGQPAEFSSGGQCSLAIVSRLMADKGKICDSGTVLRLAREGKVYQQNQLGIASVLALGPDFSARDALKWFQKSALSGYAPAQVNLAVMYVNGWGTAQNFGAALQWLKAASEQHYPRADYNLGILYMQGTGVRQDYNEARRWFQKAAEAGDSSAETNLGYLYDRGLGVPANAATASSWYSKAAEMGNPLAENNLADMYLRGEGVAQNDSDAFRWFEKAADQGHTGARIKLAYMYANGRGTKPDPEYAYALVTAATLAGDHRGDYLLGSLEHVLSPKQISAAKARAARLQSVSQSVTAASLAP
jgi:uncharacterized protein